MPNLQKFAALMALVLYGAIGSSCLQAQDEVLPEQRADRIVMSAERLGELIVAVDSEAVFDSTAWSFHLQGLEVFVVYDVTADRMRILMPIGPADDMPAEELLRLMQANFDSALDARYAIARGTLWGAYIHPLSELSDDEFLTALGETANIVITYGTSYSSGLLHYGGGDSEDIQRRELIDELRKKKI